MPLWTKYLKNVKVWWRHHYDVSMTSSNSFWYRWRFKYKHFDLLSNLAEIWTSRYDINSIWAKKAISYKNLPMFGQVFLNKRVAMAMPLVTIDWKLFQIKPYIIMRGVPIEYCCLIINRAKVFCLIFSYYIFDRTYPNLDFEIKIIETC